MSRFTDGFISVVMLAGIVIVVFGLMKSLHDYGRDRTRRDAIAAGVAEWTVDAQTGATEFRWKGDAK